MTHIKFTYYKDHGKYYSEGELELGKPEDGYMQFHDVLQAVRLMLEQGTRPGLIDGHDFHTLVTIYTQYGPLSHLFARHADGSLM